MTQDTQAEFKNKRGRSPSYPAIDLKEAVLRARAIYQIERRNWAHVDAVLHHWDYRPKSGHGLVVLAALKKFGLMEDQGSGDRRQARISELAFRIIVDDESSQERAAEIRVAALNPTAHNELWEQYGGSLPSDQTLRRHLILDKNFTERGAAEFIGEFRSTIEFAGLSGSDSISTPNEDIRTQETEPYMPTITSPQTPPSDQRATPAVPKGMRAIPLPISAGEWPILNVPFPMTEAAWQQMITMLEAMKSGIVQVPPTEPADGPSN